MPFDSVHSPEVRLATPSDSDRLYALLLELYRDNGFGVPMSPQKVRDHVTNGTDGKGGIIGIIDDGDRIVGSVGMFLQQLWFTDDWCLYERWLFVLPGHRRGRHLAELLFAFAKQAQRSMQKGTGNTFPLFTGPTSLNRLDAKMRLWQRHGQQIGAQFVIGLKENG